MTTQRRTPREHAGAHRRAADRASGVKSKPRVLALRGRLLADSLREERVVEEEVLEALRQQAVASLGGVEAVILQTDGRFSVVHRTEGGDLRALHNISGYHRDEHSENG